MDLSDNTQVTVSRQRKIYAIYLIQMNDTGVFCLNSRGDGQFQLFVGYRQSHPLSDDDLYGKVFNSFHVTRVFILSKFISITRSVNWDPNIDGKIGS